MYAHEFSDQIVVNLIMLHLRWLNYKVIKASNLTLLTTTKINQINIKNAFQNQTMGHKIM